MTGVQLLGGGFNSPGNGLRDIKINENLINATSGLGIYADGGAGGSGAPAYNDNISGLYMTCNLILSTKQASNPPTTPVLIIGGDCLDPVPICSNNTVTGVYAEDNLISGSVDNVSLFSARTSETFGNRISNVTVISHYKLESGPSQFPISVQSNCSAVDVPAIQAGSLVLNIGS